MRKLLPKHLFLLLFIISFGRVDAYTFNLTNEGRKVKWSNANQSIVINSTSVKPALTHALLEGIIFESLAEWNQTSNSIQISGIIDRNSSPKERVNNLFFASSHQYLGPSIAGVTVTISDITSGELIESNIIINESLNLSTVPGEHLYVGDIVTHELGHFLGLAHSQVQYSSMFYKLNPSQNKVSSDDRAGARALYQPNADSRIRGRIVGGQNLTGIFGAHVQAISLNDGEVKASVISSPDGRFAIHGLSNNDQYYLYIDKLDAIETLPIFYREVKSNFCQSSSAYRGSFFQSCFSRDVGFPQVLKVGAGNVLDVGDITIRCGLDVPLDYISQKPSTDMELEVERRRSGSVSIGESLVGFFTADEVLTNQFDAFHFSIGPDFFLQVGSGRELFVEVKTISQPFYSPLRLETFIERSDGLQVNSQDWDDVQVDFRLKPVLDTKIRIALDSTNIINNSFELRVTPYSIEDLVASTAYSTDDLFPDVIRFADQLPFYLLSLHVVEKLAEGVYVPVSSKLTNTLTDNKLCPDAPLSYSVDSTRISGAGSGSGARGSASTKSADDPLALGCGTIDLGGGGSGPGGMPLVLISIVGFFLISYELKKSAKA